MTTILKLGPADHGRAIDPEELRTAQRQAGYRYEIIDGKIYVTPIPNLPHDRILRWIYRPLDRYAERHPDVINYVTSNGKVIVPDRPGLTEPEPDLVAFRDFPLDLPIAEVRWEDLIPVLVVEIISEDDPKKDLRRNVELYREVPSIREYWIVDPRADADHPALVVYRRRGQRWQKPIHLPFGATYETRWLPGFSLRVAPRN
jgi:Uma2 family endonuclease